MTVVIVITTKVIDPGVGSVSSLGCSAPCNAIIAFSWWSVFYFTSFKSGVGNSGPPELLPCLFYSYPCPSYCGLPGSGVSCQSKAGRYQFTLFLPIPPSSKTVYLRVWLTENYSGSQNPLTASLLIKIALEYISTNAILEKAKYCSFKLQMN